MMLEARDDPEEALQVQEEAAAAATTTDDGNDEYPDGQHSADERADDKRIRHDVWDSLASQRALPGLSGGYAEAHA